MSNQGPLELPLWQTPNSAGYKLIELPLELALLFESDQPPTLALYPSPTAALLRTADGSHTYSLRQKNTSNALILLQTAEGGALAAVSTLHDIIELVPETGAATKPAVAAKGKWHERFGRGR